MNEVLLEGLIPYVEARKRKVEIKGAGGNVSTFSCVVLEGASRFSYIMSKVPRRVFLTGATGDVGTQVLKILEQESLPLRIICRRQKQADDFHQRGLDVVVGNLSDSVVTLSKHLSGSDTLLLLTAATPNQRQQCLNAIDAAVLAGVAWIVKISAADARDEGNVPWVKDHAAADRYLKEEAEEHGISWTILSASAFMQNLLAEAPAIRKGFLPQACGNGRAGWVYVLFDLF